MNVVLDLLKFTGLHSYCLLLNVRSDSVGKKYSFSGMLNPVLEAYNLQLF